MKQLFFFSLLLLPLSASAAPKNGPRLGVSQGISSPAMGTPINFSHGFLKTNAAAAASFGTYGTLEGDTGDGGSRFGGELGIGNGSAGLGFGYYRPDCRGCEGGFGGMAGLSSATVAGGIGFHEDSVYSAGAIINTRGAHRLGVAFDYYGGGAGISGVGVGYAYHAPSVVFALDASRRNAGKNANGGSSILVTPGLEVSSGALSAMISYDIYMNGDLADYRNKFWFGLGFGGDRFNVAVYHDYVNEWSVALTAFL